jgi:N-acetyl sugar amidotransferase
MSEFSVPLAKGVLQCQRCVMDATASDFEPSEAGTCNYCDEVEARRALGLQKLSLEHRQTILAEKVASMKAAGRGKPYDCLVGLSGGLDSSYVLHEVVQAGLRPLVVHLDNGWNSELAVHNIAVLVDKLGCDLHTHVIEWEEYKDLQLSLFKAGVVDIEILLDNGIQAITYALASRYKIGTIVNGGNQSTESMRMPPNWNHMKLDAKNIKAIQKKFGSMNIRTQPLLGLTGWLKYKYIDKTQSFSWLDFIDYTKQKAMSVLASKYGYKPYPYKHYESVFTRYYQAYILPQKFGFDKRKVHLSSLILDGQITRQQAIEELAKPTCDPFAMKKDRQYVLKKLNLDSFWFDEYLKKPQIFHSAYPSELPTWAFLFKISALLSRLKSWVR